MSTVGSSNSIASSKLYISSIDDDGPLLAASASSEVISGAFSLLALFNIFSTLGKGLVPPIPIGSVLGSGDGVISTGLPKLPKPIFLKGSSSFSSF